MSRRAKKARAPEGALVLITEGSVEWRRGLARIILRSGDALVLDARTRLSDLMQLHHDIGEAIDAAARREADAVRLGGDGAR
jgi:hypothetical protein